VATRRRNTRRRNGTKKGARRKTARRAYLGLKKRKRTNTKRRRANPIRRKRNTMSKAKRRAAALKGWRKRKNTAAKRRNARKNSVARRRNSVARRRRNAMRAPLVVVGNRRRRNSLRRRRNTYAGLRRRRNTRRRSTRRNASVTSVFNNKLVAPVQRLVGKFPFIGKAAKGYVGPIMVGAGVGAAHYYAMKGLQKVAPQVMEKISPVKYTASGILVAAVLRRVPVGDKKIRDQLAVGALLVGGALDVYRALSNKMGDLGDVDFPEHELPYGALYEDGMILDGIAADIIPPAYDGLAVQTPPRSLAGIYAGYGDGGAYDVVPFDGLAGEYASSNLGDAYALPADMSSAEGEAALGGPWHWRKRFGGPPHIRRQQASMVSPMAHRPGHRWGCIIKMIGFDRFQKIASLPPQQRIAVIASLKTQVQQAADEQLAMRALNATAASPIAPPVAQPVASSDPSGEVAGLGIDMSGLTADLGTPLYAGSVL